MPAPAPIPVEQFLGQGKLRRADIALCAGRGSLISALIRWGTRSRFSHAALVFVVPHEDRGFDKTFLIESIGNGVDITDLGHYVVDRRRAYDVVILRFEEPWFAAGPDGEDIQRLVRGHMLNFIKAEYDFGTIWQIARSVARKLIFGVQLRYLGFERTLRRTYAGKGLAPGQFICSGFVQYGYYRAVEKLVGAGRLAADKLAQVVFKPGPAGARSVPELLCTTPEDVASARQLACKYVFIDGYVYEVSSRQEAYDLLDRKNIRHPAP
jgi:hypothetical protein